MFQAHRLWDDNLNSTQVAKLMKKFKYFFNFLLHKIIKYFVDLVVYKKTFLYNFANMGLVRTN